MPHASPGKSRNMKHKSQITKQLAGMASTYGLPLCNEKIKKKVRVTLQNHGVNSVPVLINISHFHLELFHRSLLLEGITVNLSDYRVTLYATYCGHASKSRPPKTLNNACGSLDRRIVIRRRAIAAIYLSIAKLTSVSLSYTALSDTRPWIADLIG